MGFASLQRRFARLSPARISNERNILIDCSIRIDSNKVSIAIMYRIIKLVH